MAPPTKINEETEPDVLPADFGEWDSGAPPTTLPDNFNDFDTAPKPPEPARSAPPPEARAPEPPAARRRAPAPAPVYVEPEEVPEPPRQKRAKVPPAPKPRVEPQVEDQDEGESKGKGKIAIIAIAAVLLLGAGGYFAMNYHKFTSKPAAQEQVVVQQPDATTQAATTTQGAKPKPGPATPTTPAPAAPTGATPAELAENQQPTPAPVRSDAMQQQLNATSKLAGNLKATPDNGPAPTSGINMDMGNAGGNTNVFGSKAGPKVTAAPVNRTISVAASVMAGRAVSHTAPIYPSFARSARVEGTVVLHATISKAGTIENLSVISGPSMLRQAALDAVKTWRYRPYMLDNEPVEVETTVNVIFVLAGR